MAFIHQHRRKRVYKNLEPYPHHKLYYRILDGVVSVVAVVSPFAALPQLLKIWVDHDVEGISLFTWILFLVFGLPLFLYAVAHKDKKLIVMYTLGLIITAIIVSGIILFQ
jgi:uncharacterized protein with PQ loop repeat